MLVTWSIAACPGRTVTSGSWAERSACRTVEPELFFPVSAKGRSQVDAARARMVCQSCPVCAACLDFALVTHQSDGIWGGLTEDERRRLPRPATQGRSRA
jgi:WhiB family transcriptional regulator, redox-sensing transcriptional regulator